ncbi:MAG: S-adenosylmethionine decarboxylase [Anaerolineales bacterium]|nr:S-adenosylmethionine decarboxylase [Anaerolineales bacterium]
MINLPTEIKEKADSETEYWGVSSAIDLYDCDLSLMQNADAIREFVVLLCDRIKMRRYGETQVVFFGDEPRVQGFSMTQLIETSLISAHFADASRAIYLDVFSCAPYDSQDAAEFAAEYFKASRYQLNVVHRR